MAVVNTFHSVLLEIHRMHEGLGFRKGSPYVVTEGQFKPARQVEMPIDQREFLKLLHQLRYEGYAIDNPDARKAVAELGRYVDSILALNLPPDRGAIQIDLVSNAEELWALPFEASLDDDGQPRFVNRDPPVVLTRRIRSEFAERAPTWPTRPRVLFITAASSADLAPAVIDANRAALEAALEPWILPVEGLGTRKDAERFLTVLENPNSDQINKVCGKARADGDPFTHIHIFAHGVQINGSNRGESWWALKLGDRAPIQPEDLARAIEPSGGLPAVVTVAACDSANQTSIFTPERSFAQELHKAGVPIVVASQLPLQKYGSKILTERFYSRLFQGEDVRLALHEARAALYTEPKAGHDWLSMVAYVQLPEGYADLLTETGLRADLALLEAADAAAAELGKQDQPPAELSQRVERALRDRIDSLQRRREEVEQGRLADKLLEEAEGLLGSAYKRLAQLLFERFEREPDSNARAESRRCLETARSHYEKAYRDNPRRHWVGGQWLSLTAILDGRVEDSMEWQIQRRFALEAVRKDKTEFWACGTLAELLLLAPVAGAACEKRLSDAGAILQEMKDRVAKYEKDDFPIRSTRRQLLRYTRWWTKQNGFLQAAEGDLAGDAAELLKLLAIDLARREVSHGRNGSRCSRLSWQVQGACSGSQDRSANGAVGPDC